MNRMTSSSVLAVCLLSLLALGLNSGAGLARSHADLVPKMQAQAGQPLKRSKTLSPGACSTATLNNSYGLSLKGRILSPSPAPLGPYSGVGSATFDGAGNVTLILTQSFNGSITPPSSFNGSYSVYSDCTGSLTFGGANFDFVIVYGGDELLLIETDSGTVVDGEAKRM